MRWAGADWVLTSADEKIQIDKVVRWKLSGDMDEVLLASFLISCTCDLIMRMSMSRC